MEMLKVEQVSKQFGEIRAIDKVTFHVNKGEIVSIIGPNGAGKSTMLNLITKVDVPTSGTIIYKSEIDISKIKMHQLVNQKIARTFQNIRLFEIDDMSVIDNVLTGMHHLYHHGFLASSLRLPAARRNEKQMRDKAYTVLELFGIADQAHRPTNTLAFGERRLVELCRALVSDPEMIIMDEPAAGLNDAETEYFAETIKGINKQGVTVLLVEHHMGLVMNISDRIVVFNYGQKIAEGRPDEIKGNSEVKKAYLGDD